MRHMEKIFQVFDHKSVLDKHAVDVCIRGEMNICTKMCQVTLMYINTLLLQFKTSSFKCSYREKCVCVGAQHYIIILT